MINTKGLLVGGGAALVAAYLLLSTHGAGGNGGIVETVKERAGGILGTTGAEGGAEGDAGAVYNIPAQAAVTFPEQQQDMSWLEALLNPTEDVEENQDKAAAARSGYVDYADYEASYAATEAIAYGDTTGRAYRPSILYPLAAPGAAKKDITRAIGGTGRAISGAGVAGGGAIGAAVRDVPKVPAHVAKSGSAMGRAFSGLFGSVAAAATGAKKVTTVQPSSAQTRAERSYQESVSIAYGGTSKKSDYIPSQWRTREGKEITRSKGAGSGGSGSSNAAKKAISHAKRLRAGRGD